MKVLDLFSGIGGFSLGLERAGFETVAFCEIEPYCQKVLKKHWPNVPIYDDIKELDGAQFSGTIDLVCGGFPCQPYSSAGNRGGATDDRALWPEMLRVIRAIRPTWVIGENVDGFRYMGLETCLSDLGGAGYSVQTFDIPACGVGGQHRRHRLWIVANRNATLWNKPRGCGGQGGKDSAIPGNPGPSRTATNPSFGRQSRRGTEPEHNEPRPENEKPLLNPDSNGRKQGRESFGATGRYGPFRTIGRATKSPICRTANGLPGRVDRIRALGNAVVPQIPEIIGRAIMEIENDR